MSCMMNYEATSFVSEFLKKWRKTITSLKKARQVHALIITTQQQQPSPYLNNNILTIYAKCGSLHDSQLVFDTMPHRNLISFNSLISAYSGQPQHAIFSFKLLAQLEHECFRPNGSTFTSLLQASSSLEECALMGSELHARVVAFGFSNNVAVQTSLLGMYSKSGDLNSANRVFEGIPRKDSVAWNSVIYGDFFNDKLEHGLCRFMGMVRSGAFPTQFTYSMVLKACGRLGYHAVGQIIHAQVIVSSGVHVDLPLQNALLHMYCNCGDTETSYVVFRRIECLDLVSWNTMIGGYSENGDGEKAMYLFIMFLRVSSYAKPDKYTFAAIVSGTVEYSALKYGMPLHAQVVKSGFENNVYVGSTLVSMYLKNGETSSAQKVFYSINEKDVVLWTEMITGYSRIANGESISAIDFLKGMCLEGHKIDSFALSGALSACADLAILSQGEMIHAQAIKTGYFAEMSVSGSLIDMYSKNGRIEAAHWLFSRVGNPDLKCWNSMIGGYNHHGRAKDALELFDELLKHGLRPDQVTYLSILSACSHCGLVDKGKFLWKCMKGEEPGLMLSIKHYSCMASLLSRAGLLEEAEELITEAPFSEENKLQLWRSLLSSCVIKRNSKIGVCAAERVLRLDPLDKATHILYSNLCASTGKWDGVAEMRRNMRGLMMEKNPGLSWIEFSKDIHVFASGDQSHRMVDKAQSELHRLQGNMMRKE